MQHTDGLRAQHVGFEPDGFVALDAEQQRTTPSAVAEPTHALHEACGEVESARGILAQHHRELGFTGVRQTHHAHGQAARLQRANGLDAGSEIPEQHAPHIMEGRLLPNAHGGLGDHSEGAL